MKKLKSFITKTLKEGQFICIHTGDNEDISKEFCFNLLIQLTNNFVDSKSKALILDEVSVYPNLLLKRLQYKYHSNLNFIEKFIEKDLIDICENRQELVNLKIFIDKHNIKVIYFNILNFFDIKRSNLQLILQWFGVIGVIQVDTYINKESCMYYDLFVDEISESEFQFQYFITPDEEVTTNIPKEKFHMKYDLSECFPNPYDIESTSDEEE